MIHSLGLGIIMIREETIIIKREYVIYPATNLNKK